MAAPQTPRNNPQTPRQRPSSAVARPTSAGGGSNDGQQQVQSVGLYKGQKNENGEAHGQGSWTSDRFRYVGDFSHQQFHGYGELTRIDPSNNSAAALNNGVLWIYEGDFVRGQKHGRGKCIYKKGREGKESEQYEGEWAHNEISGIGCYTAPSYTYKGELKNGKRHGRGLILYFADPEDKTTASGYHGNWKENQKHGFGRHVESDGTWFEGCWINGLMDGTYVMMKANGLRYKREYRDRKLISEERMEGSGGDAKTPLSARNKKDRLTSPVKMVEALLREVSLPPLQVSLLTSPSNSSQASASPRGPASPDANNNLTSPQQQQGTAAPPSARKRAESMGSADHRKRQIQLQQQRMQQQLQQQQQKQSILNDSIIAPTSSAHLEESQTSPGGGRRSNKTSAIGGDDSSSDSDGGGRLRRIISRPQLLRSSSRLDPRDSSPEITSPPELTVGVGEDARDVDSGTQSGGPQRTASNANFNRSIVGLDRAESSGAFGMGNQSIANWPNMNNSIALPSNSSQSASNGGLSPQADENVRRLENVIRALPPPPPPEREASLKDVETIPFELSTNNLSMTRVTHKRSSSDEPEGHENGHAPPSLFGSPFLGPSAGATALSPGAAAVSPTNSAFLEARPNSARLSGSGNYGASVQQHLQSQQHLSPQSPGLTLRGASWADASSNRPAALRGSISPTNNAVAGFAGSTNNHGRPSPSNGGSPSAVTPQSDQSQGSVPTARNGVISMTGDLEKAVSRAPPPPPPPPRPSSSTAYDVSASRCGGPPPPPAAPQHTTIANDLNKLTRLLGSQPPPPPPPQAPMKR